MLSVAEKKISASKKEAKHVKSIFLHIFEQVVQFVRFTTLQRKCCHFVWTSGTICSIHNSPTLGESIAIAYNYFGANIEL